MDHEHFDDLTRSAARAVGTRRAVLRLLAGGALGILATRLGLAEGAAAKAKPHKSKPKQQRQSQAERKAQGPLQTKGKNKKKRRKKPQAPPCDELELVLCGACEEPLCVAGDWICKTFGEKNCGGGVCVWEGECCQSTAPHCSECQEAYCDNGTWRCIPKETPICGDCEKLVCESGEWVCRPKASLDSCQQCPAGKKPCDGSCIPNWSCCPNDPQPQCGQCEKVACNNGSWVCIPPTTHCQGTAAFNWATCQCECLLGFKDCGPYRCNCPGDWECQDPEVGACCFPSSVFCPLNGLCCPPGSVCTTRAPGGACERA